mmetsp:Transcript_41888/g.90482  ORF Transcript_41888/g.90482 Transcript_41888/m.90482 type:complete len:627 (-) Transcript_41888:417-2297(-)|eukprot:CAMPEP_0206514442 /NCGR_PEP_ID=MMETSP0324_2-20121206/62121_1 /ASSEMBLY_ACC=CAM_ASM_000836 /TAXON_ID=2866 /ORGANISM="Crypthecodinium cohnii, Strain Seligo" /LENGTH=626 /DNA_ID=CAMNT_0054006879 /DNA_START=128 /DNA_END=2008 /DNA_ORIENTATION=+
MALRHFAQTGQAARGLSGLSAKSLARRSLATLTSKTTLASSNSLTHKNALHTTTTSPTYSLSGRKEGSWGPHLSKRHFVDTSTGSVGGEDVHQVKRVVQDFSITTNGLGPVPSGLAAIKDMLHDIEVAWISPRGGDVEAIMEEVEGHPSEHIAKAPSVELYPRRKDEELEALTARFLADGQGNLDVEALSKRLVFGNGASELIDLLGRTAPPGPFCAGPHVEVQYKEYEKACKLAGREVASTPKDASVICLMNPNSPTGDYMGRTEMEAWIESHASPGTWVVVDESHLCFKGPEWRDHGLSMAFIDRMATLQIPIFIVKSWTTIFACPGLSICSIICPSESKQKLLSQAQVSGSVSDFARRYLKAAFQDSDYLDRTWGAMPRWRQHMATRLQRLHPTWEIKGEPWLPFLWIDTKDEKVAKQIYLASLDCGCPIRWADYGYGKPSHLRLAVRRPYDFSVLYQAMLQLETQSRQRSISFGTYADVQPSVVEGVRLVHIDDLLPHEQVLTDRAGKLQDYIRDLPVKILPAIIVDSKYQVVIDGHHRLELFRAAGMSIVPAVSVNYHHDDVLVNPPSKDNGITKETVIGSAVRGKLMTPKSTQHMVRSRGGALLPIIVLAPQIAEIQSHH